MLYSTSILEIALWLVCVLLYIVSPRKLYLIWALSLHVAKGIFGLYLLGIMPKTNDVIEALYKKESLDENNLAETSEQLMKEIFMQKWEANKTKLLSYFIINIVSLLIDCVIFFIQLIKFGDINYFTSQASLLLIIIVFFITDIIYFLWFATIRFSFPEYMISPIINAIIGSVNELSEIFRGYFKRSQ